MKHLPFVVMLSALVMTPLVLRGVNNMAGVSDTNQSYLPSIETRRTRKGFRTRPVELLAEARPEWVFIGDSMLGTRIDAGLLSQLSGPRKGDVHVLLQAASGPAYWYLAFKNVLVASGARPRATFFFFRDTNLTDTLFRLQWSLGDALDEVAHEREPELDAIVAARQRGGWASVDAALNRLYQVDTASAWIQPSVRRWYAFVKYPDPVTRLRFENVIEEDFNENFRRDVGADIGTVGEDADFAHDLPTSVLPLIAALSKAHDLPVCFVRVQRRPIDGKPPVQSPALTKYVNDFRAWAAAQGLFFHDETGDPELTVDLYEDGDHFRDRVAYTRLFRRRLDQFFR